jgi:hypothetical protein
MMAMEYIKKLKFSATCNPELTLTSSKALTSPYPSSSKDKVHGLEGPSCWSESDLRIAYYQEQGVYGNGVLCRDSSNQ